MINNAFIFIAVSIILSLISFLLDRDKTISGFKKGLKMFKSIAIPFLNILILVSLALYFIPQTLIIKYLGTGSEIWGVGDSGYCWFDYLNPRVHLLSHCRGID